MGRGSSPFRGSRRGVRVNLHKDDRAVLARLLTDVEDLLADMSSQTSAAPAGSGHDDLWAGFEAAMATPAPRDPAVARLLPDGHHDDPELAASFRRLTEPSLRARKRANLTLAATALRRSEPLTLNTGEAQALAKGLTDVRLVLAERLGLHTDEDADLLNAVLADADEAESPHTAAAALYNALTYWQDTLIEALISSR